MKLTKLLSITGIAVVTAPMITLCSCTQSTNLDYYDEIVDESQSPILVMPFLRNEKPIKMQTNKTYCFKLDMVDWDFFEGPLASYWLFIISDNYSFSTKPYDFPMSSYRIWIGQKELEPVDSIQDLKSGKFCYGSLADHSGIVGKKEDIKANSKIKFEIQVPEIHESIYGFFMMFSEREE